MTTNGTSTVNPSEVGWQFVPQYYTFVNKQPNRLHCFYTKNSTFVHGLEGEETKAYYGQQEIHNKISSIGFQDCKVFIHSVDAQSSANGGIIIQVIGEMSNQGDPWRKFVQTFFLAEQPNGYFVLNDIFRFLKEEAVEDDQASDGEAAAPAIPPLQASPAPSVVPSAPSPAPPAPVEHHPEPAATPTPPPAPEEPEEPPAPPVPEPAPEPVQQQQPNGVHPEHEPEPAATPARSPSPAPEPPATASPPPVSPPAPKEQPLPTPAAPAPQQPPQQPAPPPAVQAPAAPQPQQPPQRKTWANLAAKDSSKWGSAVAPDARGVSEAPAATGTPVPVSGPQSPAPHVTTRPTAPHAHPALVAAQTVPTPQCFIKSVTENISEAALKKTLTERFGPVKDVDILRNKACAFLEFTQLDAARRAIIASLSVPQGGEGGIRIEGAEGNARIFVETRKERGERPPPRGGSIGGERGRGGYRGGRGGPGGRGRGAPPQK
ncbi:uncharacterized protein C8Q71DRAFT_762098 [Rhodofomes roseus]|uniref:Uncharacterized protein n=1 Tax=Rhodofomes roseus TaxID=34475 RepID=A0ABQ8KF49_9APHY|nr:uncharacterized protein C8Q71DRAFT_762098 [Rhodofomes roseus]KAH9836364.1 hypothetical protein C8Q71DRAFT_762098 [Rhodofomes roseus]